MDATHYKLYRATVGGSFDQIGGNIAATVTVDSGLDANTSYEYQLESCNDNGCSGRSSFVSATTAPEPPLMAMATAQSDSAISISWSAVVDATHYKLYRATVGGSFDQIGGNIVATVTVDSGLDANTSYEYQLESCNDNGCSGRSSFVSATTAPATPLALTASAQSDSAISITWSAVADATHYKLYRAMTSGGPFAQIEGSIAVTVYVDGGLAANTSYEYQLESCNDNGCSGRSREVSATTAPEPPSALTAMAQSDSAISITWSAVAGAAYYKLYRSTDGRLFDQIGENIAATVIVDSGLAANTSYEYRLESCNDNGCSGRSSVVSATTAPATPSALTVATQSEGAISITWSAVAGAAYYKLYRATVSGGSYTQVDGDIIATDYVDSGLDENVSYYYRLESCNDNGCSGRSREISATTALAPPSAPTATAQSDSAISITWSAVADAANYKLYRSEMGEGSFNQIGGNITATMYVDSGLDANTSYEYQLESCNDNGCSGRSREVSATTAPEPPSALTAMAQSDSAISITWSAVAGAAYYKLYRSTDGRLFDQIGENIAATVIVDSGLAANTSYEYRLESCNDNGCSDHSSVVSATTAPATPSALTASAQSDSAISITWSAVADATHYKLYRATVGGSFAQIGENIAATVTVDSGLAANTSYKYQLESCNGNGCSGRSSAVSATTAPAMPLAPMAITQSDSAISITWSAVVDATHYKLYRSETSGVSYEQVGGDISVTRYRDGGLSANTSYEYQLESCNGNGCSGRSAAVSATTALAPPPAPTATAQSASEISISWSAVVDATHYKLYRSETSGVSYEQVGGDISVTRYRDGGLSANTSYEYQLESCNDNGCSGRSSAVSVTTALAPPSPATPTATATAQSDSAISITWSAVAGATHYNLYRATVRGGPYTQIGGDIDAIGYLDSGLSETTAYYYQLEACNGGECSERSPKVSAVTYAAGSLGAGRDEITTKASLSEPRAIAFSGGRAYVANDSSSNESKIISYAVEVDGRLGAARDEITTGLSDPEAIAFSGGRAYVVNAREIISYAVGSDGRLGAARDEITTGSFGLHALAFSGGRAYVVDTDLRKIISYAVGSDGRLGAARDEITAGLPAPYGIAFSGERAYVVNVDFSGNEDKITSYPVGSDGRLGGGRDEITTGLPNPRGLAFSGGRAYVADKSLDKIISYPVGSDGRLGGGRDEITTGLSDPEAIAFSGGRAYVTDTRTVRGVYINIIISYSLFSPVPFAVAPDALRVVAQSASEIEITWNAVLGATHYKLYRSATSGGLFTLQVGGDISVTRYRDDGLSANTSYYYQLEACSGDECSGRSPDGWVAPAAPIVAAQSDSEISITWSEVAGATHYKLYRSATSGGLFAQVGGDISATSYLDSGLSVTTTYYYRLEACNSGGCSGRSLEVSVVTYTAADSLGTGRDEITTGLSNPLGLAFSGGRAYVTDTRTVRRTDINIIINIIISYAVGADGKLGAARDEITIGLFNPRGIAFSGGRAYVVDAPLARGKIISYPVGSDGRLGGRRDEITTGLSNPMGLAFSGGRAYVANVDLSGNAGNEDKIISYSVGADGVLGAARDEITTGLGFPNVLAFSGGRAYVVDSGFGKIISYAVEAGGRLGASRDEITIGLSFSDALAFSGGRAYVATPSGKIISYAVEEDGRLGAGRDEITIGLSRPAALAFSGGRAYVADSSRDKIISYPLLTPVPFAIAPDAPRVVAQGDSEIEIAWNAVSGATHYKLYRSPTSGGLFTLQVGGDISVTRYRDSGLFAGVFYYYQLEACRGDECSGRSPAVKTAAAVPMAAAQSDSEISITWSAVAGATHYKLYQATVSGGPYTQIGGDIDATYYLDSALSVKTAYHYQLEACNSGGCSGRSPEVSSATYGSLGAARDEITTTGLRAPSAIAFSGGRAYVADSRLNKIISYPVEAGGELGAGRDEIATGLRGSSEIAFSGGRAYVVDFDNSGNKDKIISYAVGADGNLSEARNEITTGLDNPLAFAFSGGRAYVVDTDFGSGNEDKIISYAVEADGSLGGARDEITTGLARPFALAFSGGRAYVANYDLNGNEDKVISYPVEADGRLGAARDEITIGLRVPIAIAFSGGRAYVADSSLNKITSYPVEAGGRLGAGRDEITGLRGSALAFSGGRAYVADYTLGKIISYPLLSPVPFAIAPDAPRVVTQSESEIEIAWNAVLGATHYNLYRATVSGGLFTLQVGGDISVTRYRDGGLSTNFPYYYRLKACNGGECSGLSPEVWAAPAAPTAVVQSDSEISITWSAVAGATHYNLYRATVSGGLFELIEENTSATDYLDSGLSVGTSYYYRLEACNGGGCSGRSNVVIILLMMPPTPPRPTAAAQSDSEISITWSAVAGATHYKLYQATVSGGPYTQIGEDIDATDYLDSALSVKTAYYYRLEACNGGVCSGRSLEVSAATYGSLGEARDEITRFRDDPIAIAFSSGRAYVAGERLDKIISYPVETGGELGEGRDEITDLSDPSTIVFSGKQALSDPSAIAFSGGRAYVADVHLNKIVSYAMGEDGRLIEARDEITTNFRGPSSITTGLRGPSAIAFSGGRAYVADNHKSGSFDKIISYSVRADGRLVGRRNEITTGLSGPRAIAFLGGRAYVVDDNKIISYPVGANGELGAGRDEITTGLSYSTALAFSGERAYVADRNSDKIISYPVETDGELGAGRDEITTGLFVPTALAFSGGRAYVTDSSRDKIISYPLFSSVPFAVAPDAPRVVAQIESEIEIAWNAVLGATHYKLYRSATSVGLFTLQVGGDISVTRYRDGFSANIYYYQLEACSGDECSGRSPAAKIVPTMPMAAAQSDSEISITWSAVAGATHYKLYRATVSGGPYTQIGEDISATGYLDSGLFAKTAYYYQLEACNDNVCSGRSPEVSAATYRPLGAGRDEITTGLSNPRALAFSGGRIYVVDDVSPSDEDKIISYAVGKDGELSVGRDEIMTGLSSPRDLAFSGGRVYVADSRKIISYPVGADGILGSARDEITLDLAPSAIAFSGERAYVTDVLGDKIISYAVGEDGRLGSARDEITTGLNGPNALAFSGGRIYVVDEDFSGNEEDKIISYAVGENGELGVRRDEITGLHRPLAIAFSGGQAYVLDNFARIIFYAVDANGRLGAARNEITPGLSNPRAIAFSGRRAYVANYDRNSGGEIISYPLLSSLSFAVAPDAPRVVTQSGSEIEIAWNAVLGATHYKLYRSATSVGLFTLQVGGDISVTRYRDDFSANIYYYQLEACNSYGCSGRSPAAKVVPAMPMAVAQSDSEISITWSAVAGATHYNLYRATVSGGLFELIEENTSATGYLDSGLSVTTAYYYQLEACNDNVCSGRSSEVSAATYGSLGAARDEIAGLRDLRALAFSGGRAYVADVVRDKIISYPVEANGELGAARDEITTGLSYPRALVFSGGRAYVADSALDKIISYAVGADGRLGAARDEITTGLFTPCAIAFSGDRAYVADPDLRSEIISYAVGADGRLGARRDEITTGLSYPCALAFSGGRAYVADSGREKIISYPVGAEGRLGAGRDEIPTGLSSPGVLAFSGGRVYVADTDFGQIISYPVGANGRLGAVRNEIRLSEPRALAFLGGRAYVTGSRLYKIISYAVEANGSFGAARDETATDLSSPSVLAFFGGRAYVTGSRLYKIISYAVGANGELGAGRDEITTGLEFSTEIAFSGGRAYVTDRYLEKIISYPVGADGVLGAGRDEITTGLDNPRALAFSGGRAYVADYDSSSDESKIISYAVDADGELGAGRDEITTGLEFPTEIAFSGGRAYVVDSSLDKIISYAVDAGGRLGAGRDEITTGLPGPGPIAFSGSRAYVVDYGDSDADYGDPDNEDKIISYAVDADGRLGAGRDEITTGLDVARALAFSGGRAYVVDRDLAKIISYPLFSPPVAPDAPRVFAQSDSEIEIAWNAVLGATHYKLYRSETSGGMYDQIGGDISITRYLNDGLSANTSYYYQLEACSGDECSGRSPEVSATTDASGASGSRGAASADDADDAVAKRQQDSDPIESSSEACNGDECSQRSPEVLTATRSAGEGVFHASGWVVGLDYQYGDGEIGKTGEKGAFPLRSGQTIVFSTGQVTLGAVSIAADANADFFTPTRLGDQARAIRIERLLIALDSDGENDNGVVSLNAESASDALTAWNAARVSDDEATTPINGRMRAIPSAATAATLLKRANNCAFSGAFAGRWTDADGNGGEHAMVLLAFNEGDIDGVSNPRGVFAGIDQITGGNSRNGKALWIKLWNQGGGLQSAVTKYGAASGALSIDLSAFPVVATMTASNGVVMTITVESYGKIGYAVGGESGVLNRVRQEIPNADYRLAGFYSNDDRATPPGEQKPEIGIFAASIDEESEKLEPYIGRFLTDGAGVYSNIGHSKQDAAYTRQGTPADGTITIVADDGREIELRFTEQRDGIGYGAYEDTDANGDDGFDVFGGWCKL